MYPSIVLNRRDFLSSTSISLPFFSQKNITKIDEYAHWSIYGLIPPPIEKSITYNELINEIYNKNIIKLQQAPQHDCVVATTTIGHRWACLIKDNDIENINKELKLISNNLQILPIEQKYVYIRSIWLTWITTYISLFITSELGLIDIDLIGYTSIAEKEAMIKSGKKRKRLLSFLIPKKLQELNETKIN
tara:strand:- start:189 stop:758 length:570 start_codon:yes stop_codon:yes gene_type:complete